MTRVGRYNASYGGVTGNLFVYGEAPVTSSKLNLWDGNIDAGFWLVHRALRMLAGTDEIPKVIGPVGSTPLKISAQASPDMTVQATPGILVGPSYLAGLSASENLPTSGNITAPTTNPRIDTIGILETGEWVMVTGTEASSPTAPTLPESAVALADVYLRVGATMILDADNSVQAYLIDRRPAQVTCQAHQHESASTLSDVTIEGSLNADGPVEFGDSTHTLTVFQPACEGTPVTNSSGVPEVLFNGQENFWYPRQSAVDEHVSFACPHNIPGTRIKEFKLILRLASSGESFNLAVFSRPSQSPESFASLVEMAAADYIDSNCTLIANNFFSFSQTLNYTIPANNQIWVYVRLKASSFGTDCSLLGLEWTFEGRSY